MRIGLSVYNMGARDLLDLAVAADETGFDALWLGEHLVLPYDYSSEHPTHGQAAHQHHLGPIVGPATRLLDPWSALSAAAALTTRVKLATGIYILPLRHPLLTARAACTTQEIAAGRFMLGVGAGWLREEFAALGVPFGERGSRLEESLAVLRSAWGGGPFEHRGTHFTIDKVQVTAEPVTVPLVLGGNTDRALRRAARVGDAWFSSGTPSFSDAVRLRDQLAALCEEQGRAMIPCYFRLAGRDPELVCRYDAEGITDLVVWADQLWCGDGPDAMRQSLAQAVDDFGI
ncbi:TIGR03619 family F420-dependent LLM class oxidoreductase, partial [Frankia sp. Cj5]|uniref:TIGR03619 family F420-dependent LLM class oxidoreductase n=1 Tax=Frankia sp. Cj5 TaxID=2880978 RepID=UPI001EF5A5D7